MGIAIFLLLYFYSTALYPGGSQADIHSAGFSWLHNYWCNLFNAEAINGQENPARLYAISAMTILCLSLMAFFALFANLLVASKIWKWTIIVNGVLSMLFAIFMFTEYHDLMTTLSSVFGVFVVIGILKEVAQSDLTMFKVTGLFCLALLGLNNVIYYTDLLIHLLPVLQKVSFAIVLSWVIGLNLKIWKIDHS